MAPPIDKLSTPAPQSATRSPLYDTTRRKAAQRVRDAQDYQRQKTEDTNKAKNQADTARERLQAAKIEEQQAAERVRAAKADEQQAIRASQQQLRGRAIDVVA